MRKKSLVSPTDKDLILEFIPPTNILNDGNLADFCAQPRENLVLKSAIGHGGEAVFCGSEYSQADWVELLQKASSQKSALQMCIIQEWVEGDSDESCILMPEGLWLENETPQILGIFQVDGDFCGGIVRKSLDGGGVVNAAKTAAVGIIRAHRG